MTQIFLLKGANCAFTITQIFTDFPKQSIDFYLLRKFKRKSIK